MVETRRRRRGERVNKKTKKKSMEKEIERPYFLFVGGPTGSGKSNLKINSVKYINNLNIYNKAKPIDISIDDYIEKDVGYKKDMMELIKGGNIYLKYRNKYTNIVDNLIDKSIKSGKNIILETRLGNTFILNLVMNILKNSKYNYKIYVAWNRVNYREIKKRVKNRSLQMVNNIKADHENIGPRFPPITKEELLIDNINQIYDKINNENKRLYCNKFKDFCKVFAGDCYINLLVFNDDKLLYDSGINLKNKKYKKIYTV
jgi:predicted ABC-type ATPase